MKTFITAATLTIAAVSAFLGDAPPEPELASLISTRTLCDIGSALQAAFAGGGEHAHASADARDLGPAR